VEFLFERRVGPPLPCGHIKLNKQILVVVSNGHPYSPGMHSKRGSMPMRLEERLGVTPVHFLALTKFSAVADFPLDGFITSSCAPCKRIALACLYKAREGQIDLLTTPGTQSSGLNG
jgi:hypothetical protein